MLQYLPNEIWKYIPNSWTEEVYGLKLIWEKFKRRISYTLKSEDTHIFKRIQLFNEKVADGTLKFNNDMMRRRVAEEYILPIPKIKEIFIHVDYDGMVKIASSRGNMKLKYVCLSGDIGDWSHISITPDKILHTPCLTFRDTVTEMKLSNMSKVFNVSGLSGLRRLHLQKMHNIIDVSDLQNISTLILEEMDKVFDVSMLKNINLTLYNLPMVTNVSTLGSIKKLYIRNLPITSVQGLETVSSLKIEMLQHATDVQCLDIVKNLTLRNIKIKGIFKDFLGNSLQISNCIHINDNKPIEMFYKRPRKDKSTYFNEMQVQILNSKIYELEFIKCNNIDISYVDTIHTIKLKKITYRIPYINKLFNVAHTIYLEKIPWLQNSDLYFMKKAYDVSIINCFNITNVEVLNNIPFVRLESLSNVRDVWKITGVNHLILINIDTNGRIPEASHKCEICMDKNKKLSINNKFWKIYAENRLFTEYWCNYDNFIDFDPTLAGYSYLEGYGSHYDKNQNVIIAVGLFPIEGHELVGENLL